MKIYEKPLVDVRTFDVEDVMTASTGTQPGEYAVTNTLMDDIVAGGSTTYQNGVVFEW